MEFVHAQETQAIYEFWDGDYTFHFVEYPDSAKNFVFRVRIDNESAEDRMRENERNHNNAPPGWTDVRLALRSEISPWLSGFSHIFPQRSHRETAALRFLKLNGSTEEDRVPGDIKDVLKSLTTTRPCVRDFQEVALQFVRLRDGVYFLTADGHWLTALMK